ncbi:MAG: hypothetical protein WC197_07930 [Candidatus Gastranaerophilaceae bacterium]|jgi:PBP1b-binding outer membrane lipoprotein LpoB
MSRKYFKKIEKQMIKVGIELNKLESLSRILSNCIIFNDNLKNWDIENLSLILAKKILETKQKFNEIEVKMKI